MSERKSFLLRTDARTLDLLKAWADDEFRSLNSQVEYLLKRALKESGRFKDPAKVHDGSPSPPKESAIPLQNPLPDADEKV